MQILLGLLSQLVKLFIIPYLSIFWSETDLWESQVGNYTLNRIFRRKDDEGHFYFLILHNLYLAVAKWCFDWMQWHVWCHNMRLL